MNAWLGVMLRSLILVVLAESVSDAREVTSGGTTTHEDAPYWLDSRRNCGPACIAFLDNMLGGGRTLRDIVARCPLAEDGTSLLDVKKTLESFGYVTQPFEGDAGGLVTVPFPAVLHYHLDNSLEAAERGATEHFVVVVAYDPNKDVFLIFDPPSELSDVPFRGVARRYSGLGLAVSRTAIPPVTEWSPAGASAARIALNGSWIAVGVAVLVGLVRRARIRKQRALAFWLAVGVVGGSSSGCVESTHLEQGAVAAHAHEHSDERSVERGIVQAGEPLKHRYRIVNGSGAPLTILGIEKGCCSTASVVGGVPLLVRPDDACEVDLEVSTAGIDGAIKKDVTVVTDSALPEWRAITLHLSATSEMMAVAIPKEVQFGVVRPSEPTRRDIEIALRDPTMFDSFEGLDSDNALFTPDIRHKSPGGLVVSVAIAEQRPYGAQMGHVSLRFNNALFPELVVPVSAHIKGDVRCTPARLALSQTVAGTTQRHKVRIDSLSETAFRIIGVECPPGVALEEQLSDESSSEHFMYLTCRISEMNQGSHSIAVKTDKHDEPSVTMSIVVPSSTASHGP